MTAHSESEPTPDTGTLDPQQPAPGAARAGGGDELARLSAERDEYLLQWRRAQADYQNLRRRAQSDHETALRSAQKKLFGDLLLVLDYLQMALASPAESNDAKNLAMGVKLTHDQLVSLLEREDVREIPTSASFDPNLHEAIEQLPDAGAPGRVLAVVRKGYTFKGQVLRPAQVRVSAPRSSSEGAQPNNA